MDDVEYQQCRAAFAVVVKRWTDDLEAHMGSDIHQLSDDQLEALRLKFQAAFEEVLTFLDQAEHFGELGETQLLVDVTQQIEGLRAAGHSCAELQVRRRIS